MGPASNQATGPLAVIGPGSDGDVNAPNGSQPSVGSALTQLPNDVAAVDPVAPAQDDGNHELAVAEAQFRSSVVTSDSDSLLGAQ